MSNFRLGDSVCLFDFYADHSGLSNMELDKLVELFDSNNAQRAEVGGGLGSVGEVIPKIRESNVLWFDQIFLQEKNCWDIHQKITQRVDEINDRVFKFDLLTIEPFQLTQYTSAERGFYDYHIDASPITKNMTRKLSFVIQLNNPSDFVGGDFCVIGADGKELNVTQERPQLIEKGNIIVFPSFMPHKVTPVTSGKRHSLVGWCSGPRFR